MDTKYNFTGEMADKIVYVRPIQSADLPKDVRNQVGNAKTVYSVHNSDGEQLALVGNRNLAFVLARQNDFSPVNVH